MNSIGSWKILFLIYLISYGSFGIVLPKDYKKLLNGKPGLISPCVYVAHFMDGSGTYNLAVDDTLDMMPDVINSTNSVYISNGKSRHIIGAAAYDYFEPPRNATSPNDIPPIRDYFDTVLHPYRGIFDLQTSVNTFLKDNDSSSYDHDCEFRPWAVIWPYSDTINGYNNLLNAISNLILYRFLVIVVTAYPLTSTKLNQLTTVLSQSNIVSLNMTYNKPFRFIAGRIKAGYDIVTANHTGLYGNIEHPDWNGSGYYPLREYYIMAPSENYVISLQIIKFYINPGQDYVYIFKDGLMDEDHLLYTLTGSLSSSDTFDVPSSSVAIRLIGSEGQGSLSFNITWIANLK